MKEIYYLKKPWNITAKVLGRWHKTGVCSPRSCIRFPSTDLLGPCVCGSCVCPNGLVLSGKYHMIIVVIKQKKKKERNIVVYAMYMWVSIKKKNDPMHLWSYSLPSITCIFMHWHGLKFHFNWSNMHRCVVDLWYVYVCFLYATNPTKYITSEWNLNQYMWSNLFSICLLCRGVHVMWARLMERKMGRYHTS